MACIDQTNGSPEMAAGIGTQGMISHNTDSVSTWRTRHAAVEINQWLLTLRRYVGLLSCCFDKNDPSAALHSVQDMVDVIRVLSHDPWFSSLWILRKAYLRNAGSLKKSNEARVYVAPKLLTLTILPSFPLSHGEPRHFQLSHRSKVVTSDGSWLVYA